MQKFKNKKTGEIYIVKTQSVVESFKKNPLYTEVEVAAKTLSASVKSSEVNDELKKEAKNNNGNSKKGQK